MYVSIQEMRTALFCKFSNCKFWVAHSSIENVHGFQSKFEQLGYLELIKT